jgi:hypothetical protein
MRTRRMGRVRRRPRTMLRARGDEKRPGMPPTSRALAFRTLSGARNGIVGRELAESELLAGALFDELADAVGDRHPAGVDADERDGLEVVVPLDDLVRDAGERPADRFLVQQDTLRPCDGRVRHTTPFRPLWTGLKGRCGCNCRRSGRTE